MAYGFIVVLLAVEGIAEVVLPAEVGRVALEGTAVVEFGLVEFVFLVVAVAVAQQVAIGLGLGHAGNDK